MRGITLNVLFETGQVECAKGMLLLLLGPIEEIVGQSRDTMEIVPPQKLLKSSTEIVELVATIFHCACRLLIAADVMVAHYKCLFSTAAPCPRGGRNVTHLQLL